MVVAMRLVAGAFRVVVRASWWQAAAAPGAARSGGGMQHSNGGVRARMGSSAAASSNPLGLKDPGLFKELCYVDGKWVPASSGETHEVHNPADGSVVGHVPRMNAEDTNKAIEAAHRALPGWRELTAAQRGGLLRKWYDAVMDAKDDIGLIITKEGGKPLSEAKGEVEYGAAFIEWYAEEAKRIYGDILEPHVKNRKVFVLKQPIGVVGAITPWNFPIAMITRKVAPALAAGCTIVVKPSEQTPFTALACAELADRVGIPPGVLNVVVGEAKAIGDTLISSELVRKITFTGSTAIGKQLMAGAASTVKKVSLELGGNAPLIVFDDADLDAAVTGAIASKYRNAGQTCVSINRMFVQEGVYDEFTRMLSERVSKLKVGEGTQQDVLVGPLINERAVNKVEGFVKDAVEKGAEVVTGGERHELGGQFYSPTVIKNMTTQMRMFKEEVFGPVSPVFKFQTEEEAVHLANDTEFGLAAYFYTRNIARAWRVAESLEYGMVGLNETAISTANAPFGGIKESGLGREGSRYGLDEYLELKYLALGGLDRT
eukprot:jgi/Chlat1/3066/Chrsp21S03319